ncbi:MAG TPA: beta-ketoacyl-[acyl-carrier-protein] synthase family protein [Puia sp.]|jgi:3-oxoacyl-(acyl-carrier-protein) synthase|nr:beta-ketoacyl-[acyl-carrier-protein] synthase family protein [Puia sp.]
MSRRVVITGMGVVSPNGVGIPAFLHSIRNGVSGIRYDQLYKDLNLNCQVAGMPEFEWDRLRAYVSEITFHGLQGHALGYGIMAALDAWTDAGNTIGGNDTIWDTGCVFGSSVSECEVVKKIFTRVDAGEAKKLGSRVIEQMMNSSITAYISGRLGLGNRIIATSAACATGTQAILMGSEYIRRGTARRMVVGSSEHVDPYIFGAFDSMRILSRKFNATPEKASRPMSQSAAGFVPGSGAGALVLEDLEFALGRGARIYAELLGGACNSGGQRNGGSMTAPASPGVIRCIRDAVTDAGIDPQLIDLISGHLTATAADTLEIQNWCLALDRNGRNFPPVNSLKSMIGHCLSAAGSIESVAAVLQIVHQFIHPNINLDDPNPEILQQIDPDCLPVKMIERELRTVAKANFGFGDVNACLIFSKYN